MALIGGGINLTGGTLQTTGGRIELGSVASDGLVSIAPTDKGFEVLSSILLKIA